MSMGRKKKEDKKESFSIEEEMMNVNVFLRDGFRRFLYEVKGDDVKTKKKFYELLEEYGGV